MISIRSPGIFIAFDAGMTSSKILPLLITLLSAFVLESNAFADPTCTGGQHWDPSMKMCMCDPGETWDPSMKRCMPNAPTPVTPPKPGQCPDGQQWDSDMNMCMDISRTKTSIDFHMNAFLVGDVESGPRGRNAVYSPNMWMFDLNQKLSANNTFKAEWMGTTELWTVPKDGIPELLQVGESKKDGSEFVDAQHPHSSPVMGLTFEDIIQLNKDHKLTFFFAPRGEATAGVPAFMHRASSEPNPNVPLGHHVGQDVLHISSTVSGAKYDTGKTTFAISIFSGKEPLPTEVNLDMHKPDSVGVSVSHDINSNLTVGASFAQIMSAHQDPAHASEAPEPESMTSAWAMTKNKVGASTLMTTSIFGEVYNKTQHQTLNSFLEEFVDQLGKNEFFGRVEVLQRTPDQLQIQVLDGSTGAEWVKAATLGYERKIFEKGNIGLYAGGSYTKSVVPSDFMSAYGGNPDSAEVHLRLKWIGHKDIGKPSGPVALPDPSPHYSWFRKGIVAPRCLMCHSTTQGDGDGLVKANFDTYENLMKQVTPGDALHSPLYLALFNKEMPKPMDGMEGPPPYLTDVELNALFDWIEAGAKNN